MSEEREYDSPEAFNDSPSFRRLPEDEGWPLDNSPQQISAAAADEFEFAFVMEDTQSGNLIAADEIISDGNIRPIYPVFNRDLLLSEAAGVGDGSERRRLLQLRNSNESIASSSTSFGEDLEAIKPGTYCLWNPGQSPAQSPSRVRKSGSTGSSFRLRIRDLVFSRSHSDGKEKFVFLAAEEKSSQGKAAAAAAAEVARDGGKKKGKGKKASEIDLITAHRKFYGQNGDRAAAMGGAAGRKSYLPYKPDIVGFFAGVNGLRRVHHPF